MWTRRICRTSSHTKGYFHRHWSCKELVIRSWHSAHPEILAFLFLPLLLWGSWQRTRRKQFPSYIFLIPKGTFHPGIPLLCIVFLFSDFSFFSPVRKFHFLSVMKVEKELIFSRHWCFRIDACRRFEAEPHGSSEKVLSSFVEELTGNRVGIIIFSKPFTNRPHLWYEYSSGIHETITTDSIEQRYSGLGGTIGDALLSAVKKFGDGENRFPKWSFSDRWRCQCREPIPKLPLNTHTK